MVVSVSGVMFVCIGLICKLYWRSCRICDYYRIYGLVIFLLLNFDGVECEVINLFIEGVDRLKLSRLKGIIGLGIRNVMCFN